MIDFVMITDLVRLDPPLEPTRLEHTLTEGTLEPRNLLTIVVRSAPCFRRAWASARGTAWKGNSWRSLPQERFPK